MKCDQNCLECELPPEKCTGGPKGSQNRSALPWRNTTKTSVGKGDIGMFRACVGKQNPHRYSGEGGEPTRSFAKRGDE